MDYGIVDASVMIAAVDMGDERSEACSEALARPDLRLVIPAMCVAEAAYLVERNLGSGFEEQFLRGLEGFDIRAPEPEDWPRIADLVRQYSDFPLGGTDASVVALAERVKAKIILTLDRRHFSAIRPLHCPQFQLLPEI